MKILRRIYVFNGDADGLCAVQQLRLAAGRASAEVRSGPKRRTRLLADLTAGAGDEVTVLDVSFHSNRAAAERLLDAGARLRYFDHHYAGALPEHPGLEAHIDAAADVCTSVLVDRHLEGRYRAWAVVGAFGDNLAATGRRLALEAGLDATEAALEELGVLLNYNSYGETEADLHIAPLDLHERLLRYDDPLAFTREDAAYRKLAAGYAEDMARAAELRPSAAEAQAALYLLPDAGWARRVSGVLANRLARAEPERAHALLSPNGSGGMLVSVRAPLARPSGAAALCLLFEGGGGREGAAGINHLALEDVARFTARFMAHFAH